MLLPELMVSWGEEKGHYVPNIFLIIGKEGKKQKCQQIQNKANYLRPAFFLLIDLRDFCFEILGRGGGGCVGKKK